MKLRDVIKESRLKKGMSQVKLAKVLGYSSGQFVSNWERGESFPPVDRLARISLIFELDKDGLISQYIEETAEIKKKEYYKFCDFHAFQSKEQK